MKREFRREKYSGVESNRENKITFRSCDSYRYSSGTQLFLIKHLWE